MAERLTLERLAEALRIAEALAIARDNVRAQANAARENATLWGRELASDTWAVVRCALTPAQRDDVQGRFDQASEIWPSLAAAANEGRITEATALLREYCDHFNAGARTLNEMMRACAVPTSTDHLAWGTTGDSA